MNLHEIDERQQVLGILSYLSHHAHTPRLIDFAGPEDALYYLHLRGFNPRPTKRGFTSRLAQADQIKLHQILACIELEQDLNQNDPNTLSALADLYAAVLEIFEPDDEAVCNAG